ncbi:hypothetical protein BofuT4_uP061160.1 [Botrytis cinerea T4]|uniref:Uncharacterized protein n=1 Tax=Botryotinia fuckeliana (strain T4) TaxID=999810 RepID=G2XTT6_BOTF4|nr:hypothetical protein BofuT4_uP061160.1 [Botrytis cinerea T4]
MLVLNAYRGKKTTRPTVLSHSFGDYGYAIVVLRRLPRLVMSLRLFVRTLSSLPSFHESPKLPNT